MADDTNEDSWLYGTSNPDSTTNDEDEALDRFLQDQEQTQKENEANQLPDSNEAGGESNNHDADEHDPTDDFEEDEAHGMEEGEVPTKDSEPSKDPGDSDDDDSDDDINVVIGDIKSAPTSGTYNIKQRQLPAGGAGAAADKKQTQGKFNIEEFESVGTINGMPAHEYSLENLEEKPWRKPGADITDYFNYGFNEDTWRAYCERQKKYRLNESGVGLSSLSAPIQSNATALPMQHQPPPNMNNMPPMVRTLTPLNNGNANMMKRPVVPGNLAKENVIQVMTAECREYSRPGGPLVGPPGMGPPGEFFEEHSYEYGYEPTQESQWMNDNPNSNPNWMPTGIKELTPGQGPPGMGMPPPMRPPMGMGPPMGPPGVLHPPHGMMGSGPPPHQRDDREGRDRERSSRRERSRSRERDRDRDYDRRDRDRDRDYDRRDRDRRDRDREDDDDREKRRREREREREERESSRRRTERSRSRDRERRRRSRSKERSDRDSDRKSSRESRDKKKSSDTKSSSSSSRNKEKLEATIKEEPADQ